MSEKGDNVIHVQFGKDGTHRKLIKQPDGDARTDESGARGVDDPLEDLYGIADVARLFDLEPKKLRQWEKKGFAVPSVTRGKKRYYTFQDLISVRAAKGLVEAGVPERVVQRSVEALRASLPKVVRPLTEMRVVADGHTLLVQDERGAFEPTTGQRVLDFSVDTLKEDVVRVLRRTASPEARRAAYDHYLEGCRLDEDEATMDRAEEAYRRALSLDPGLACALTNLGNLCYRRGRVEQARTHYAQAIAIDTDQPEAHYNLGFLALEDGDAETAVVCFERALESDPSFADAHFNIAMAEEERGFKDRAKVHWETYLSLEPEGAWAEIARRHLGQAAR